MGGMWHPDGLVRYRVDATTGERVATLPATCKLGLHSLSGQGGPRYTAREESDGRSEAGRLVVVCLGCKAEVRPDYAWHLVTTGPRPKRAELDDGPYLGCEVVLAERPAEWPRSPTFRFVLKQRAAQEAAAREIARDSAESGSA